jgi:hypothetical protein
VASTAACEPELICCGQGHSDSAAQSVGAASAKYRASAKRRGAMLEVTRTGRPEHVPFLPIRLLLLHRGMLHVD